MSATYTILSMMKDEGHSLLEWVCYHRHIGFDNICVYTNNCNDGTDAMLIRLEQLGLVHHFRNDVPEGKKPQPNALSLATKNPQVTDSDWILTMDADEFLSIKTGRGDISDLIAEMPEGTDAMAITWRFFGSNGVTDWNPGLVTESYTRAAPDDFKKGWGVKTIFRPYPNMKLGIHRPHIKKSKQDPAMAQQMLAQHWVNGSGQPMPDDFALSGWRSTKPTLGYDLVELNHYAVKSYEAYLLRRMRGNVNNKADKYNAAYFSIFDRNEIEATNATRHARATRRMMTDLLEDETLATLQRQALEYHAERVAALRTTGEYDAWLTELKQASEMPMDRLDEVLFTQHLPRAWQEKVQQMRDSGVSDRAIALMIARSQTARKSATRAALRAAADGNVDAAPDVKDSETQAIAGVADRLAEAEAELAKRDAREARRAQGEVVDDDTEKKSAAGASSAAEPVADMPERLTLPRYCAPRRPSNGRKVVVSTMKNEGPYILEWVAYHKSIGFDDFVLFSNDCSDGTNLILNRLDQMGIVQHSDNPLGPRMDPQRAAYSRARRVPAAAHAEWALVIDADEFLNVKCGDGSVDALIAACDAPDAISVNWRLMGSSGEAHMRDGFVTRRFTHGSDHDTPENGLVWGFKTLFRPTTFDYFAVHRPRFFKDRTLEPGMARWVNGSGRDTGDHFYKKGWRSNADMVGYDLAQVNHYAVKSREEFLLKRLRGTANSKNKDRIDTDYWDKFNINTHYDNSIRSDGAQALIDAWMQDAELSALVRACHETCRRAIAYQMRDEKLRRFVESGSFAEAAE
ncbi:glycosyltransferase family 2 protein [Pacificitalea manganoxidans]|nr:glycosyltransferase family 2 protein [Pacificitalea manganoxidans]MDR6308751.1 hypothetical protein [Pacificitalea manganoxidans]